MLLGLGVVTCSVGTYCEPLFEASAPQIPVIRS